MVAASPYTVYFDYSVTSATWFGTPATTSGTYSGWVTFDTVNAPWNFQTVDGDGTIVRVAESSFGCNTIVDTTYKRF